MLSKEEVVAISEEYKRTQAGIPREKYLERIHSFLERKEILILRGVRRSGKSTLLRQLIDRLRQNGVPDSNILYINLEDYRLLAHRNFELLQTILDAAENRAYVFLDEIQAIPLFESWLKTQYDTEVNAKFIISGSGSQLLSRELGTLLTGRSITFDVFPLDYEEFHKFTKAGLAEFLEWGGFPEVVLADTEVQKRQLLQSYTSAITEKDILLKRAVQEPAVFEKMLHYLLTNPGVRVSVSRLSKHIGLAQATVEKYLTYAAEAYLIFEVPFFSHSAKSKFIRSNVPKYYVIDNGFFRIHTTRNELSKQLENAVALKLLRSGGASYWAGKNEVDFIISDTAIQVTATNKIHQREQAGLDEAQQTLRHIQHREIVNLDNAERFLNK